MPEVRALCSAGVTRPRRSYGPVRLRRSHRLMRCRGRYPRQRRVSLVARTTMRTCRAHYPGGSERVHVSIASPFHAAFPKLWVGRHPHCPFRGLLRLHSRYGPHARSTAQGGLCHGASTGPVARPRRPSATSSIDNSLGGTLLHRCFAPSRRTRVSGHPRSFRSAVALCLFTGQHCLGQRTSSFDATGRGHV